MISDRAKEQCILGSKDYFPVKHPDRVKQLSEVFTPTEWNFLERRIKVVD